MCLDAEQPTIALKIPADLPARDERSSAKTKIDRAGKETVIIDIAVTCICSDIKSTPVIDWAGCMCRHLSDSKAYRGEGCRDEHCRAVRSLQSREEVRPQHSAAARDHLLPGVTTDTAYPPAAKVKAHSSPPSCAYSRAGRQT